MRCLAFHATIFSCLLFGGAATSPGDTTYYVDSSGSDNHKGTSAQSAWKSLAKLYGIELKPGGGYPEILLSRKTAEPDASFQVWTGAAKCLYAIDGIGAVPLGIETAAQKRPDLDGNNKADVLLLDAADAGGGIT
jgi:hypothetical protein